MVQQHDVSFNDKQIFLQSSLVASLASLLAPCSSRDACFCYCAYFRVHSEAVLSCCFRFFLYSVAISGTRGSSGLGSVSREQIDKSTLEIVKAGLQLSFRMSKHIPPLSFTLQWYILVWNLTLGGLKG